MKEKKKVALVAHDNMKRDLAEWVDWNWEILLRHHLVCTGTTGKMVTRTLTERGGAEEISHFDITLLKSGPLGGDQQLGSMIADGEISALIFFWDPMSAQPHDVDVKALLRIATLYNVPTAINRSSADFLISSPLFEHDDYRPVVKDYTSYIERVEIAVHGTPMQKGVDRPSFSFAARGRTTEFVFRSASLDSAGAVGSPPPFHARIASACACRATGGELPAIRRRGACV